VSALFLAVTGSAWECTPGGSASPTWGWGAFANKEDFYVRVDALQGPPVPVNDRPCKRAHTQVRPYTLPSNGTNPGVGADLCVCPFPRGHRLCPGMHSGRLRLPYLDPARHGHFRAWLCPSWAWVFTGMLFDPMCPRPAQFGPADRSIWGGFHWYSVIFWGRSPGNQPSLHAPQAL